VTFVVAGLYFAAKGGPEVTVKPDGSKAKKQNQNLAWVGIAAAIGVLWLIGKSQEDRQPRKMQDSTETPVVGGTSTPTEPNPASQHGASHGSDSKPSNPEAKQKYDLAVRYLARNQPNWGVNEAVDIVVRYPDSHEAILSAVLIMDNCDHIGFQEFCMLTGYHLPVDRELPRSQQIEILMSAFQQRGIIPKKADASPAGETKELDPQAQAAEFEREFFQKYPDLKPHRAIVDAVAVRIRNSGNLPHSREARMVAFAKAAREQIKRQQQAPPATANNLDEISSLKADAEKGDASSQAELAAFYRSGVGVPYDPVEAYKWYSLAAAQGSPLALRNANEVAGSLTTEQLIEGRGRIASTAEAIQRATTTKQGTN